MNKKAAIIQDYGLFPDFRVQRQINLLQNLKYNIDAIVWRRNDKDVLLHTKNIKAHTIYIKTKYGLSFLSLMMLLPRFWFKAYHLLRNIDPHIIICNNFPSLIPSLIYKLMKGGVIVYESREPSHKIAFIKTKSKIIENVVFLIEKMLVRWVDRIVTVTPNMVKMYAKMGYSANYFPNAPTADFITSPFFKPDNSGITVGFIGNIRPNLGINLVWNLVKSINSERGSNDIKLLLCGPILSDMEKAIKNMAEEFSEQIEVLEPVDANRIPEIYKRVDITFVLPENNEKFSQYLISVKLFESLAAGVSVIASDIGENRDILGNNSSVMWVSKDYHSVREAFKKLIDDPELRLQNGILGSAFIKEHFNWEMYEHKYKQMLLDVQ